MFFADRNEKSERAQTPLKALQAALREERLTPVDVARECGLQSNGSASRNTYLQQDLDALAAEAQSLTERYAQAAERPPLYGVPVALKDCFDARGTVTSMGSRYLAQRRAPAQVDSAMAERLRALGCLLVGKTHLHPLAWGITGENADYGDSVQPRDATRLTGGSSSGAAASVQEGSALFAVGTDTGGSIRVPAALCGLVGYRASHSIATSAGAWPRVWRGAGALAHSLDTPGMLLRDGRDLCAIAGPLFGIGRAGAAGLLRIGVAGDDFLSDSQPEVIAGFHAWQHELRKQGHAVEVVDTARWAEAMEIFSVVQAHEAAGEYRYLPAGDEEHFGTLIAQRMRWGWSLAADEVERARERLGKFRVRMAADFEQFDLLMLPCAPVAALVTGSDLSKIRPAILRYTAPFSLAGVPALALPGELLDPVTFMGTGVQIAAPAGKDGALLSFAADVCGRLSRA